MAYQLPPLSSHIRVLTLDESARLDEEDPFLPKSLSDCVTCNGKKTFRWWRDYSLFSDDKEIVDYDCPCAEQFILFKYLLYCGLEKQLQRFAMGDLTHVDPDATIAMGDFVTDHEYFLSQGKGLLFQGDRGTGKTLLAVLMLKQLLDKGIDGHYVRFDKLIDAYTNSWRDDEKKVWFDQKIRAVPLLVIDDIGKEYSGMVKVSSVAIDNLLRSRVQSGKPTVITTNLTPHEMARNYSTALETMAGQAVTYQFTGKSFRGGKIEAERNKLEIDNRLKRPITIS